MSFFTVPNFMGYLFFAISCINVVSTMKQRISLGALKIKTPQKFKYTLLKPVLLIALFTLMWIFIFIWGNINESMLIFYASVILSFYIYMSSLIGNSKIETGFYEKGVSNVVSILLYEEILSYTLEKTPDPNFYMLEFKLKKAVLLSNKYKILIQATDITPIKSFLKKQCSF